MDIKRKNTALISARKKVGLTQLQVAEKAKVSERTYQNYEAGGRVPNVHTARRIAQVMGLPFDELF